MRRENVCKHSNVCTSWISSCFPMRRVPVYHVYRFVLFCSEIICALDILDTIRENTSRGLIGLGRAGHASFGFLMPSIVPLFLSPLNENPVQILGSMAERDCAKHHVHQTSELTILRSSSASHHDLTALLCRFTLVVDPLPH